MSSIDILRIRQRLGRKNWGVPERFGPDGWRLDGLIIPGRIIITNSPVPGDDADWLHASISHQRFMPTYEDLTVLHKAVWPDGYAYQVFAPPAAHINIHAYALHLWGKPDGERLLPDFGAMGTI
jgi:hypothetical protein